MCVMWRCMKWWEREREREMNQRTDQWQQCEEWTSYPLVGENGCWDQLDSLQGRRWASLSFQVQLLCKQEFLPNCSSSLSMPDTDRTLLPPRAPECSLSSPLLLWRPPHGVACSPCHPATSEHALCLPHPPTQSSPCTFLGSHSVLRSEKGCCGASRFACPTDSCVRRKISGNLPSHISWPLYMAFSFFQCARLVALWPLISSSLPVPRSSLSHGSFFTASNNSCLLILWKGIHRNPEARISAYVLCLIYSQSELASENNSTRRFSFAFQH